MRFLSNEIKLDFDDVMLEPRFGGLPSRSLVKLTTKITAPRSGETFNVVPIIAANMDGVGTIEVARELYKHNVMCALTKHYDVDTLVEFFSSEESALSFYSMGINSTDWDKFVEINEKIPIKRCCIDVANGYQDSFYDFIKQVRIYSPYITIMAGNVVTSVAVERAAQAGADIIKIGIGGGAQCTTRLMTGVGYPQLSAIIETKNSTLLNDVLLCSDGGCTVPGDVSKAIAAGANLVMLGTMLAGTDEGGGDIVDGKVLFYGMSSKTANNKHFGGLKNYRSSEGRTTMIPYKGTMADTIGHILGGIASTCTYVGANTLAELPQKAYAIRVNNTHNKSSEKYTIGN